MTISEFKEGQERRGGGGQSNCELTIDEPMKGNPMEGKLTDVII